MSEANSLPTFPMDDRERRVVIPVAKNPETGQSARGIEGLRAAVLVFPRTVITRRSSDVSLADGWQPIAAAAAIQAIPAPQNSSDPIGVDGLDRVSWWLTEVASDMPGPLPTVIPEIRFAIRACPNCGHSTQFSSGIIQFDGWGNGGLIAQISGILCSQWEMWMQVHEDEDADSKVKVRLTGAVDRSGGGSFAAHYGPLVVDHNP